MNNFRFENYIFDLDGTLTDSRIAIGQGVIGSLEAIGINHVQLKEVEQWIGRPLYEIYSHYLEQAGRLGEWNDTLLEELVIVYREHHDRHFEQGVKIYPGVIETLEKLRDNKRKIAIATTKYEEAAVYVVQRVGLGDFVDAICGTDPGKPVKPDPFVIQLALSRLGCTPEEALVVGDTAADIEAAHSAKCPAAAVKYGFGNRETLKRSRPEYWLERITELP